MRCFIHSDREAISVCKQCGKAMCADCSAYSGHNGICPECRNAEFIEERDLLEIKLNGNQSAQIKNIVLAVVCAIAAIALGILVGPILFALLIGTVIFAIRFLNVKNERKPLLDRISFLNGKILKLENALQKGTYLSPPYLHNILYTKTPCSCI